MNLSVELLFKDSITTFTLNNAERVKLLKSHNKSRGEDPFEGVTWPTVGQLPSAFVVSRSESGKCDALNG